ncbi:MAG: hypothetical protein ACYSUF_00410 [Planctomycetota bacterium]|jgi:hypothetical protein
MAEINRRSPENSFEFEARLRAAGLEDDFKADVRELKKKRGAKRGSAEAKAAYWELRKSEKYRHSDDVGDEVEAEVQPGGEVGGGDVADVLAEFSPESFEGKGVSFVECARWVSRNLHNGEVDLTNVDPTAVSMLRWARKPANEGDFWRIIGPKVMQGEKAADPFVDDPTVPILEATLDKVQEMHDEAMEEGARHNKELMSRFEAETKSDLREELLGAFVGSFPECTRPEIQERLDRLLGPRP